MLAVAAGGIKLWLARGQPLYAVPAAPWDDRLFLQLAGFLRAGRWLGPYDRLTLAKGPFYPMFMAAASWLRLPLITANNLVYLAACWVFVRALRPLKLPLWTRVILLLALLFCPILADSWSFVRAWRQSLWPGLVLLSFGGTIGVCLRSEVSFRWQLVWATLAGAAVAAMWLTREEARSGPCRCFSCPCSPPPGESAAHPGAPPASPAWRCPPSSPDCWWGLVAGLNFRAYGFFGVVEMRDDAFVSAYSALCRVKPLDPERRIPVTREAREKIYAVSPAFASLRHEVEEGIGAAFMQVTQDNTGIPAGEHQIGGGWMIWTLREAVADTGQAKSAAEARAFYRRLADEVNAACDDGRLSAAPRRHSLMPPWDPAFVATAWAGAWTSLRQIVGYSLTIDLVASFGTPEDVAWVERFTHDRASPPDAAGTAALVKPRRLVLLRDSMAIYRTSMPWLLGVAVAAWIFLVGRGLRRRELRWLVVIAGALALGIAGNIAVVTLVNATSWPSINLGYLGASAPLAVGFVAVTLAEFALVQAPAPPVSPHE